MPNDDTKFLSELPRDFHENYKSQKKSLLKKIDDEFSDNSNLINKKSRGIQEDKFHKEVLNACIFPFVQQGPITQQSNYSYLRSSPLSKLGLKNVDFLIASRTDGVVIFGEAKGSITDPSVVISQYKKRIKIIKENIPYITQIFPELKSIEYVLGVQSVDAMETSKAILRSNANIILWQVSKWDDQLLSLVVPTTEDATQQKRVMHCNSDLNKILSKVPTSTAFKTFYHESHPVTKMTLLTSVNSRQNSFAFDDFKTLVIDELDNTSDEEINKITQDILDSALDIGFVKSLDDENYKVQSRFKKPADRYEELKKKWIARKIELDKEHSINEALEKIQTELLAKKTSLDKF